VHSAVIKFPALAVRLDRFSSATRQRLSRALARVLGGRRHDTRSLHEAIDAACHELRLAGLDNDAIEEFLGALVEETGRACGADRPSLISGEMLWVPVRARVLDLARTALTAGPNEPFLDMDHVNGPR
jgi:hypothetical protein